MPRALRIGIWIAVFCAVAVLVYVFRTPYRLADPRSLLNGHFSADFGIPLPALTRIPHAQAAVARVPEQVFEADMTPADLAAVLAQIHTESERRHYEIFEYSGYIHPYYDTPVWWNNSDGTIMVVYILNADGRIIYGYGIRYDLATGGVWIYWGGY